MNNLLDIKDDIKKALNEGKPVVALESTIISHGMPYPQNLEMAKKVESIIKDNGALPATIAVLDGVIKVGLEDSELETLAQASDVMKLSKRDIPYALANKKHGATTVSATMMFAKMAGIKVFATGGIGGVHRGINEVLDISRDLEELATTDVTVVCAGAKSILDLENTLEYLETKGVLVVGYKTDELPAFYTRESGLKLPYRVNDALEVAKMMVVQYNQLGFTSGMVVANPIPTSHSMDKAYIDNVIQIALKKAENNKISGKDITPFLLNEIQLSTKGRSLEANLALVYHNAKVAAQIALDYAKLELDE